MPYDVCRRETYKDSKGSIIYEEHVSTDKKTRDSHTSIKINQQGQKQYCVGFDSTKYPNVWWAQVKNDRWILTKRSVNPVDAIEQVVDELQEDRHWSPPHFDVSHLDQALNKYMNFELDEVIEDSRRRSRSRSRSRSSRRSRRRSRSRSRSRSRHR